MEEIRKMLVKRGFSSLQLLKDLSGADRVIGGRFE
jgi:methylase of polypeptide subunit release factors